VKNTNIKSKTSGSSKYCCSLSFFVFLAKNTFRDLFLILPNRKKEKQPSVFNGLKFRLHRIVPYDSQSGAATDNKNKMEIHIELGITDYKSFVGTHLIPLADREVCKYEQDLLLMT